MDSSYAASADDLNLIIRRAAGQIEDVPYFVDDCFAENNINNEKYIMSFEEEDMTFERGGFQIILNSTNTDLVSIIIYLKRLD